MVARGAFEAKRWQTWCVVGLVVLSSTNAVAFGWPDEANRVARALDAESAETRQRAAADLADLSRAQAGPLLRRALGDTDVDVQLAAAGAFLEHLDESRFAGADDLSRLVVPWLSSREPLLRIAATEILRAVPLDEAIQPLSRVLSDRDPKARMGAARALGATMSAEATPGLLGTLDDPEAEVRVAIIEALTQIRDERALLPLLAKAQDAESSVRLATVRAVWVLDDRRASSTLVSLLRDRDVHVVRAALEALADVGDETAALAIAAVARNHSVRGIRREALATLARLPGEESARALIEGLVDPESRVLTARSLSEVSSGSPELVNQLGRCLEGTWGTVVAQVCARTLAHLMEGRAVRQIREALERGVLTHEGALAALAVTNSHEALVPALEGLLEKPGAERSAALHAALSALEPNRPTLAAWGPIFSAWKSPGWSLRERKMLVEAMGRTGAPEARDVLAGLLDERTNDTIRLSAARALGQLPGAHPGLIALLDDSSPELRRAAAWSLRASASSELAGPLLTRLERRRSGDLEAMAVALSGPFSAEVTGADIARLERLIEVSAGGYRDALIEALGANSGNDSLRSLERVVRDGTAADRAKVAEVLAFRGDGDPLLERLVVDSSREVRITALWAVGVRGIDVDPERLSAARSADDAGMAANALGAWIRLRQASAEPAKPAEAVALCKGLDHPRQEVRANAVAGLDALGVDCPGEGVEKLLVRDPSELVRRMSVRLLSDSKRHRGLLRWCALNDRSQLVASECRSHASRGMPAPSTGTGGGSSVGAEARRQPTLAYLEAIRGVFERAPYDLLERVGPSARDVRLLRVGVADRRAALLTESDETVELVDITGR